MLSGGFHVFQRLQKTQVVGSCRSGSHVPRILKSKRPASAEVPPALCNSRGSTASHGLPFVGMGLREMNDVKATSRLLSESY